MISLSSNKRYLITGGSGYLGHALIARLASMGILDIAVIARNEGRLIELKEAFPHIEIIPGNIADPHSCAQACAGARGLFHLAAAKHVTMAQTHVRECVTSNVVGALNLLEQTLHTKPDFIVGISTDKSGRPNSIYGSTKYLQDKLFAQYERIHPATAHRVVKYGNVVASTGSFITKWKARMERGEEVFLTDPEATRFFFTVDAAVDLIFSCMENATDATPYLPVMKAARMGTMITACQEVYGKCPVKIIGLQPGESLHETMDGLTFSNQVEQFTKEEIIETFLRPVGINY